MNASLVGQPHQHANEPNSTSTTLSPIVHVQLPRSIQLKLVLQGSFSEYLTMISDDFRSIGTSKKSTRGSAHIQNRQPMHQLQLPPSLLLIRYSAQRA